MNYQNQRTKYGKFMFNLVLRGSKFLMKHMWLYYLLSYTWGIIMTLIGWIVLGFIRLFLYKKVVEWGKFGPCHYAMLFDYWGGLELGTNFLVADKMGKDWTLHTKQHETGHTFQNALLGPLAIFLVFIPSAIRYWLDVKVKINNPYDAIWFEGSASSIGEYYYDTYLKR